MSATHASTEGLTRLTRLSLAVYRALLLLYPARFRRAYATQMTQVFRASCSAAARRGGALGIAHVWRLTLGDLAVTALAERYEETIVMERRSLNRAAGLAGLIGGALLLFYGVIQLVYWMELLYGSQRIASELFPGGPIPWLLWALALAVPLVWVCVIAGMLGLLARLMAGHGVAAWLAGAGALIGAGLGLIGSLSLILGSWAQWSNPPDLGIDHFEQLGGGSLPYLGALDLYGRMVVGLSLLAVALMLFRGATSRKTAALTLLLGVSALLPYLYISLAVPGAIVAGVKYGGTPPYTPITLPLPAGANLGLVIAMVEIVFSLVWGCCWLLLGARFLREERSAFAGVAPPSPTFGLSA